MTGFIDENRAVFGVEPICRVLAIAPSTYYARAAIARDPGLASDRAKQDEKDSREIVRVFGASRCRYGARKVWHTLRREGYDVARCTVERLMKTMGLQGVVRGKKVITTNPDTSQPCPDDKVNRAFVAETPNQLWGEPAKAPPVRARRRTISPTSRPGEGRYTSPSSSMSLPGRSSAGASPPR